ncbi:hypothetical protein LDG_7579 [Legionella drancourtii LLAP12]|uniref:Uncharacterized protein n=1 Tax=Legionella drancourtii LLAP12 TaxID=658187 RepID=G9EQN1_9GAMM|nr:hypothetical protein LDG_7579 [Legionella drancourtii LLAP12]
MSITGIKWLGIITYHRWFRIYKRLDFVVNWYFKGLDLRLRKFNF